MNKTNKTVAESVVVKKPAKQIKKEKKPLVKMISYSIKMVIPTGQYANIQPEIIVKSGSIEDAHNFIAPHMNKLWKEYYLVNERRPEPAKSTPYSPAPTKVAAYSANIVSNPLISAAGLVSSTPLSVEMVIKEVGGSELGADKPQGQQVSFAPAPASSVALIKATQAIESCLSLEALELIEKQVIKSVKLSHEDKEALMPLLSKKGVELTFPN